MYWKRESLEKSRDLCQVHGENKKNIVSSTENIVLTPPLKMTILGDFNEIYPDRLWKMTELCTGTLVKRKIQQNPVLDRRIIKSRRTITVLLQNRKNLYNT